MPVHLYTVEYGIQKQQLKYSEKAPNGYGLGSRYGRSIESTDLNTIFENGWYSFNGHGTLINGPEGLEVNNFAILEVSTSAYIDNSPMNSVQIYTIGHGGLEGYQLKRRYNGTNWSAWCWINPPMSVGVEYRTTERYMGLPVYTSLIDTGVVTNGKNIAHGVTMTHLVRTVAICNNRQCPYIWMSTDNANSIWCVANSTNIYWFVGSDMVGQNTHVQMWYTK